MDFHLIADLDVEKTAEIIKKKDLPKLQDLLNKDPKARLKLIAELDLDKTQKLIKSQLNQITVPNIKLGVDIDKNISQINPNVSTKQIDSLPAKIAIYRKQLDLAKQSWSEQGYNIQSISNQFAKLGSRLGSITKEVTFDRWVNDFNELNAQVRGLETNLNRQIEIQNNIYKIQTKIATLDPNKNIEEVTYYKDQLETQNKSLTNLKTQATVYSNLLPLAEQENYITEQTAKAREKLAITTAKMADKQNSKLNIVNPKDVVNVESVSINVEILKNRIEALRKANPKAAKSFASVFDGMLADLDKAPEKYKEVSKQLQNLQAQMKATGKTGNTLFGSIKANMEKFAGWMSMTGVITEAWHGMKQMVTEVKNINTEMINLQKVTDETDATYTKFLKNATKEAQKLSSSVTDIIEQTATWSKLGYNLNDAQALSEVSMIYSKVGEVDNTTAVSDLVTVMKSFNIESENSIHIVDSLNELGNNFATDAASLGEGLTKSASALNAANNSFEQSIALLTGGTEITQNASEMGSALRTVSMRIRGMKGELQALGEEYEDIESVSKIQTQILNLTEGKVNIFDNNNNFRSTYDILKDVAEIYDDLSDPSKADISEILFGKTRGNQGLAILQAFQSGQIEKAYKAALNSAGSAQSEFDAWSEGIEASINRFTAAFQTLSEATLDDDFLKGAIDAATSFVSALADIVDKFGLIKTLVPAIAAGLSFKNVGEQLNTPVYAQSHLLCA